MRACELYSSRRPTRAEMETAHWPRSRFTPYESSVNRRLVIHVSSQLNDLFGQPRVVGLRFREQLGDGEIHDHVSRHLPAELLDTVEGVAHAA